MCKLACHFVRIADAIVIRVVVNRSAGAIGFARARFADSVGFNTRDAVVRSGGVVVARRFGLAS